MQRLRRSAGILTCCIAGIRAGRDVESVGAVATPPLDESMPLRSIRICCVNFIGGLGNPRHSRLGGLRYDVAQVY